MKSLAHLPVVFAALALSVLLPATSFAGNAVTYKIDGQEFEGYRADIENSKGLVVMIHDWDGLTDYEIKRAGMLNKLGYAVFAIDLFGKGNRPVEVADKRAEIGKLYKDRATMRKRILGGLAEARKGGANHYVVMGYCFGGSATLELARSGAATDPKGYVSFHGGLKTPEGQSYPAGVAPLQVAHGGADTAVPMTDVAMLADELEKAGATYEIEVYSGAPHAFTVFGSKRYQERADKKSWAAFVEFLTTQLGG